MQGYWKRPEETGRAFHGGGWFRTGDIGCMAPDGQFIICDRKKDMIIVSGFNVYPNEVEEVAASFDGVTECACVGRPSPKSGETVVLYVVQREPFDKEALRQFCTENLAPYKVPRDIRVIEALPKTPVGKILRSKLRTLAEDA